MTFNLDTDWILSDVSGSTAYYGYAVVGSSTASNCWAIRKVSGTPSQTVVWNDNLKLSFNAKWKDRVACFATPSNSSLTQSVTQVNDSFGTTTALIKLDWSEVAGVNDYLLTIIDQNGVTYNNISMPFLNNYVDTAYTNQQVGTASFYFRGVESMTYSVTLTCRNQAGSTSSTIDIVT